MDLKDKIAEYPDFPKRGVLFRDIWPIVNEPEAFNFVLDRFEAHFNRKVKLIAGIESRGFVFASALAARLRKAFVPIRKQGKLPGPTVTVDYEIEYGSATMEMQTHALTPGNSVVIIDDLLATGGTAEASARLVTQLGGNIIGFGFVVELRSLGGKEKLQGFDVFSLVEYE
ncbi:MAG: adenine phosphoribosyltransferase [Nitrososphaerales archaeon]